ncbi:MAG TPA: ABC transporter substrate-binding protein [Vicinamibacterales bacterium]|nr:ABC transporter substrate-binding protein [Vicinamibacterales bacterium]
MAAHKKALRAGSKPCAARSRLLAFCSAGLQACLVATLLAAPPDHQITKSPDPQIDRIISLVPAATEMLYAIGAGPRVVGVSSYDSYPPEVKTLPKVGALLDPNVELMLSLKPRMVVVYGSQVDLKEQLGRAGVAVFDYRHAGLADVTTTIRALGERTGTGAKAEEVARGIERGLDGVRRRVQGRPRPRTLLVFGRERLALRGLYASGGVGFLNDMLDVAGGSNVFGDVKVQAVQASTEQLLARRPDVILETRAVNSAWPSGDHQAELNVWNALASVPAVRNHRVLFLFDDRIVIPGPRVVEGTTAMAKALHPDAFK